MERRGGAGRGVGGATGAGDAEVVDQAPAVAVETITGSSTGARSAAKYSRVAATDPGPAGRRRAAGTRAVGGDHDRPGRQLLAAVEDGVVADGRDPLAETQPGQAAGEPLGDGAHAARREGDVAEGEHPVDELDHAAEPLQLLVEHDFAEQRQLLADRVRRSRWPPGPRWSWSRAGRTAPPATRR